MSSGGEMTYVITEPCVGTLDASCAEVCPVDCIHPAPGEEGFERTTILYVDPSECIDCNACLEVCPVDAPLLEADVPSQWEAFAAINRAYYEEGLDVAERLLHEHLARRGLA
jgi:NAD-dependent dihydropyrimidine dehydrogenase PreA subunit